MTDPIWHEVTAKSILTPNKNPDAWFGVSYNLNIYRGCQHGCIYCDPRSECYGLDRFDEIEVKVNAVELLQLELASKRVKGTVGTGSMSDPYLPLEVNLQMTRKVLEVIVEQHYPLHIITKSDLVVRDLELIARINQVFTSVAFTVTTVDDDLASKLEPHAPAPSLRLKAMARLAEAGIYTGILMTPVLPWVEDTVANVTTVIRKAREHGAQFIIASFGMSLRDRQREYYYQELERLLPGIAERYRRCYGNAYRCVSQRADELYLIFKEHCLAAGLAYKMDQVKKYYPPVASRQLGLFEDS